jgi:hypothetical protein
MLCLIAIIGRLLLMIGQHSRSEALFYYFRLEDHVREDHLLRSSTPAWVVGTRYINIVPPECLAAEAQVLRRQTPHPYRHRRSSRRCDSAQLFLPAKPTLRVTQTDRGKRCTAVYTGTVRLETAHGRQAQTNR